MALLDTLTTDMKVAMKARDNVRRDTLRLLIAALKTLLIDQKDFSEADELSFLSSQAKRRRESIEAYENADRADLADKEKAELTVIEDYLPKQLTPEEVRAIVQEAVAESGAETKRDMGKVMKLVMPKVKGRFPGKEIKPLVESLLS